MRIGGFNANTNYKNQNIQAKQVSFKSKFEPRLEDGFSDENGENNDLLDFYAHNAFISDSNQALINKNKVLGAMFELANDGKDYTFNFKSTLNSKKPGWKISCKETGRDVFISTRKPNSEKVYAEIANTLQELGSQGDLYKSLTKE